MTILEKMIVFFMIYLLCYQIFLVHFHSKIMEGYELVLPKFSGVSDLAVDPVTKPVFAPVNKFLPTTRVSMDFDNNSVSTQIT